ncbi:MAG: glutamine--fructose-6-phosphate transaminase (isomerizing) [Fidelibacterota bacterium]|nr:MAG: glutamine--fructose-6-phosphate transaminase (isomerizing) [Candidatus Neomarinimicrobiota bacterium]
MCGIVGYNGYRPSVEVLIQGLHRLEYRGYDSAGITIHQDGELRTIKKCGKIRDLEKTLPTDMAGSMGMGHTRWATHGVPNDINAHPHLDSSGKIALVHNGIIENHHALRQLLEGEGHTLGSETDTEVLAEYIGYIYGRNSVSFPDAVRMALTKVVGAYGIVAMCEDEPELLVAARLGSPLVLGVGEQEMFVASDATPIVEYTRNVVYLSDGEMAMVNRISYEVLSITHNIPVHKSEQQVDLTLEQIEKGGYPHFMLKEIMEQETTIPDAMRGRMDFPTGKVNLGGIRDWQNRLLDSDWIYITACGTSWHAALIGGFLIEALVGIPTKVEYASEFRYRKLIINPKTTVMAISQSGETADTLAAVHKANEAGTLTMGIVNAVGSSVARETNCGVFIHAGPEIGVASTKAFTSQLTVLMLVSLLLAQQAGESSQEVASVLKELAVIEDKVKQVLAQSDAILDLAREYQDSNNFLYLGRGFQFPIALEGALKLKEISYIHAEGYPAAEMKHGPIALIDENMPVVVMALKDRTYEKVLSNIQEIKARKGRVIAVANDVEPELEKLTDHIIQVPTTHRLLLPLLTVIPLQLLAYHIAVLRDCHVDQPRNLAKSVTVE